MYNFYIETIIKNDLIHQTHRMVMHIPIHWPNPLLFKDA